MYDGIRLLYRHTRVAPHQSVMGPHPPPKRHGWDRPKKRHRSTRSLATLEKRHRSARSLAITLEKRHRSSRSLTRYMVAWPRARQAALESPKLLHGTQSMRALTLDKLFHRVLVRRRQRLKLQLLCQIFCLQRRLSRLTRHLYRCRHYRRRRRLCRFYGKEQRTH